MDGSNRVVEVTPQLREDLATVFGWAEVHVADASAARETDRQCYELIKRVADVFGIGPFG